MNRGLAKPAGIIIGVPHMRGDEPEALPHLADQLLRSPHAWG